jgi:SseB protein N-terminal domain
MAGVTADGPAWAPTNDIESGMFAALRRGDTDKFLRLLISAELVLPVTEEAADRGPVPWSLTVLDDTTCVPAFTSPAALAVGTRQQARHYRTVSFRSLVASWPDPSYPMLLNPFTPLQSQLGAADLVALAGTPPDSGTVLQQVMSSQAAWRLLDANDGTVSGYAVRLADVAHLDTLDALRAGLPLPRFDPEIGPDPHAVYLLRWLVPGGRAAASTGVVAGTDIPLFSVTRTPLPHDAELLQLTAGEPAARLAYYDVDERSWLCDPDLIATLAPAPPS